MTLNDYYRSEQDQPSDRPAVSLSADGGHGGHCYDGDTLICGWPDMHTRETKDQAAIRQSMKDGGWDE